MQALSRDKQHPQASSVGLARVHSCISPPRTLRRNSRGLPSATATYTAMRKAAAGGSLIPDFCQPANAAGQQLSSQGQTLHVKPAQNISQTVHSVKPVGFSALFFILMCLVLNSFAFLSVMKDFMKQSQATTVQANTKAATSKRVSTPLQTPQPNQCSTSNSSEICPSSLSQHSIGNAELQQLWEDAQAALEGNGSEEGCILDGSSTQHLPHRNTAPSPAFHDSMHESTPGSSHEPSDAGNKVGGRIYFVSVNCPLSLCMQHDSFTGRFHA